MWRQYRPRSGHTAASHIPCSGREVILSCGERLSRGKWGKHTPPWDPCLKAGGLILGTKPDLVTIIMNMQQRLPRQLAHLARNNPLSPPYAHGFFSSRVTDGKTETRWCNLRNSAQTSSVAELGLASDGVVWGPNLTLMPCRGIHTGRSSPLTPRRAGDSGSRGSASCRAKAGPRRDPRLFGCPRVYWAGLGLSGRLARGTSQTPTLPYRGMRSGTSRHFPPRDYPSPCSNSWFL